MSDYTPSTDRVEDRYRHARRLEGDGDKGRAEFDRWLSAHEAEHEKAVRERIAQDIVRELGDGRAADIAREGA